MKITVCRGRIPTLAALLLVTAITILAVAGGTYTISVASKRYTFTPRTFTMNDSLTNIDLVSVDQFQANIR